MKKSIRKYEPDFYERQWSNYKYIEKRPLQEIISGGEWRGRRCFILGGGPSLKDFDFSILRNDIVIACNRAFEYMPEATVLFAFDGKFYQDVTNGNYDRKFGTHTRKKFYDFNGLKIWADLANIAMKNVFYLRSQRYFLETLSIPQKFEGKFPRGNNSGYGALIFAIVMGCNPIYLLGYDMKKAEWFHDGHTRDTIPKSFEWAQAPFHHMHMKIKQRAKIINCNKNSGLRCFDFGDLPKLPGRQKVIFVTFYTKNYENYFYKLRDSFWKWGLKFDYKYLKAGERWLSNCNYKATFCMEMLDKHKCPIVWVDADARILRYPALFDRLDNIDFAAYYGQRQMSNRNDKNLLSGTLYFNNTPKSYNLLTKWIMECKGNQGYIDQANLRNAFHQWDGNFFELPIEYCTIYDGRFKSNKTVIEHYQASRITKTKEKS